MKQTRGTLNRMSRQLPRDRSAQNEKLRGSAGSAAAARQRVALDPCAARRLAQGLWARRRQSSSLLGEQGKAPKAPAISALGLRAIASARANSPSTGR